MQLALGTDEQLNSMKELFLLCDKNGDGEVTFKELSKVFQELKIEASKEEVHELFEVSFFKLFFFFGIKVSSSLPHQKKNYEKEN